MLKDPKEKAEHAMLVDLARNDLGRVCEHGSVKVTELMNVEKYSHVMHIVSTVEGRPKAGENAFSLLRAAFPAGTLAGAPKIRAMEIITELEGLKRGPYGGAVGYFSYTGNMDTCIFTNRPGHRTVQSGPWTGTLNWANQILSFVHIITPIITTPHRPMSLDVRQPE